jgi:hypothetical protein
MLGSNHGQSIRIDYEPPVAVRLARLDWRAPGSFVEVKMPTHEERARLAEGDGNLLLDALGARTGDGVLGEYRIATYSTGAIVAPLGHRPPVVLFPVTALLAERVHMQDGSTIGTTEVGNEGLYGLDCMLRSTPEITGEIVTAVPGSVVEVPWMMLRGMTERWTQVRDLLLGYAAFRLAVNRRLTACNALHPVVARLARWLLFASDRVARPRLDLTYNMIADLLGVHVPIAIASAGFLANDGAISCQPGSWHIVDRPRLEQHSCECYADLRAHLFALSRGLGP